MIDLYAMASPNVQKIYIMLEECRLDYRDHQVNIWKGEHFSGALRELNPNAKVPIIVDREPSGSAEQVVFESGAILMYLAEKAGLFLPASGPERYETLQWLMVQMTTIGPMLGQFNHFTRFASDNAYGRSRYTTQAERLYALCNERLGRATYLAGDDYTVADIATFPWIRTEAMAFSADVPFMKIGSSDYPHLWRWFEAVEKRDGVQKALTIIDRNPSTIASATPDEIDRVLGRGKFAYQTNS